MKLEDVRSINLRNIAMNYHRLITSKECFSHPERTKPDRNNLNNWWRTRAKSYWLFGEILEFLGYKLTKLT